MQQSLINHAKNLGIEVDPNKALLLLEYLNTLITWNKIHNLCGSSDFYHMLGYHILDSLSVPAKINCNNKEILDVGTGAGLPGIPIAIITPSAMITLLEPNTKKMVFLTHIINKLQLKNICLTKTKVENYMQLNQFDLVISRAFCDIKKFVKISHKLIKYPKGKIVAMKSDPKEFMVGSNILTGYHIEEVKEIQIPLVKAKRTLVIIGCN